MVYYVRCWPGPCDVRHVCFGTENVQFEGHMCTMPWRLYIPVGLTGQPERWLYSGAFTTAVDVPLWRLLLESIVPPDTPRFVIWEGSMMQDFGGSSNVHEIKLRAEKKIDALIFDSVVINAFIDGVEADNTMTFLIDKPITGGAYRFLPQFIGQTRWLWGPFPYEHVIVPPWIFSCGWDLTESGPGFGSDPPLPGPPNPPPPP